MRELLAAFRRYLQTRRDRKRIRAWKRDRLVLPGCNRR
jgi:hypothetical protein